MIFARKIFFPEFWEGSCPSLTPVSYAYGMSTVPLFTLQSDSVLVALISPDQKFFLHGIDIFLEEVKYLAEWVDTAGQRLYG